ncbi:hypothetical protein GFY24_10985 [Nocardia sp. SYP-A9097]|uniref:hypothetical protein n=1 Tax=Nocardia sp. SYP-A9097 TaxID=2663237 RepID=UPI00129B5D2A|nr:hypothetical protein [Nocardia sp. SYP-A9097]MRH87963.1 hypothetical protein [Nocardia sp. SYP-A9097]
MSTPSESTPVVCRRATPADAAGIAELYDRVYGGHYPITECTDPALIGTILTERDYSWFLAVADDIVVGSSVAVPDSSNGSCEIGRAAVRPEYAGHGSFAMLFDATVADAVARPENELLYGFARSDRARYLFERIEYPIHWTGTDGGMHRVGDAREEHLIGVTFNPKHPPVRILPPNPPVRVGSLVDTELRAMIGRTATGPYPAQLTARRTTDYLHESAHGRVAYSLFEPSRAAVVGELDAHTPADVRRLLWEVVDQAPARVEHLTVYVVADKQAVIAELCAPDVAGRAFTACAYLPGWHRGDGARYDCVMLTLRLDGRTPLRLGFNERVEALHTSLTVPSPLSLR